MEAATAPVVQDGRHDFDFLAGRWETTNRKRTKPLVQDDDEWVQFEAWFESRPILGGLGNVDRFVPRDMPDRPGFEGFTLRLFDPEANVWRIWWASTISKGQLDVPVVGGFGEDGIGIFECDDVLEGIELRVRYTWTILSPTSLRWEQAFSSDGGGTWDVNWITESTRAD